MSGPEYSTHVQTNRSMRPAGIQLWKAVNAAPWCVSSISTTGARRRCGPRAGLRISPRTMTPPVVISMAGARRRFHLSGIRFQPFRHLRPRQLDEARALGGGSENGPVGRGTPRLETATGEAKEEHDRHDDRRNEKQQ